MSAPPAANKDLCRGALGENLSLVFAWRRREEFAADLSIFASKRKIKGRRDARPMHDDRRVGGFGGFWV